MKILRTILSEFQKSKVDINQDNKVNIDNTITYKLTAVQDKSFGVIGGQELVQQPEFKPAVEVLRKIFALSENNGNYAALDLLNYFDTLDGKTDKFIDLNSFKQYVENNFNNANEYDKLRDYLSRRIDYYRTYPKEVFSNYKQEYWLDIKETIVTDLRKLISGLK